MSQTGHPWPLFDLRIRTPRVELRLPTDDDLLALLETARDGIVDEGTDVFLVPWHELPSPAFERQYLLHHWSVRGSWNPDFWRLPLVAIADGRAIGMQEILARQFATRRVVNSGSWLGRPYQGLGYGTEMRAAILWLAFESLGANEAQSGYIQGNAASRRVSEKLGYTPNGIDVVAPRDRPLLEYRVRVTRETWNRDAVPVEVEGIEACLPLFGAEDLRETDWRKL